MPKKYLPFIVIAVFLRIVLGSTIGTLTFFEDSLGYAYLTNTAFWGGTSDMLRPPFFPLFAMVGQLMGLPFPLYFQFVYIGIIFWLTFRVGKLLCSERVCLAFFLLLLFHPVSFNGGQYFASEPVYTLLWLILSGNLVLLTVQKKLRYSVACGVVLGLMAITRHEKEILILTYLYIIFIGFFCLDQRKLIPACKRLAAGFLPFFLIILFVCSLNKICWGHFTISSQTDGCKALMSQIYRIKPSDTTTQGSLTYDMVNQIGEKSPKFAALIEQNVVNKLFHSEENYTADVFQWAFVNAAAIIGTQQGMSINQYLLEVSDEFQVAMNDNPELFAKTAVYPYNLNIKAWIHRLPTAFVKSLWYSLSKFQLVDDNIKEQFSRISGDENVFATRDFDQAAMRRTLYTADHQLEARGVLRYLEMVSHKSITLLNTYYLQVFSFVLLLCAVMTWRSGLNFHFAFKIALFLLLFGPILLRCSALAVIDASWFHTSYRYYTVHSLPLMHLLLLIVTPIKPLEE